MQRLYDKNGKEVIGLSMEQAQKGILDGSYGYLRGQSVNLIGKDGQSYSVPSENVPAALEGGWSIESPVQTGVREYLKENEGIKGTLKVALGQFADEALFGIPELVADKTQDPMDLAKREALKKQHYIANALGGTAGFAASMLYGGEGGAASKVGEGLERGILGAGERAAVDAAEHVAPEAAAHAAPEVIDHAVTATESALERVGASAAPDGLSKVPGPVEGILEEPGSGLARSPAVAPEPSLQSQAMAPVGAQGMSPAPTSLAKRIVNGLETTAMPEAAEAPEAAQRAFFDVRDLGKEAREAGYASSAPVTPEVAQHVADQAHKATAEAISDKLIANGASKSAASAAAPSLARRIIASAVRMGFEGAVMSTPQAVTEAMLGDPDEAAETLLYGIGAGAVLGAVGKAATIGGSKVLSSVAPKLGQLGEEAAAKSIDPLKKYAIDVKRIGYQKFGRTMLDNGWVRKVGEELPEYAERIQTAKSDVGTKIGDLWKGLDAIGAKTGLHTEDLIGRFRGVENELSRRPGFNDVRQEIKRYIDDFERIAAPSVIDDAGNEVGRAHKELSFEELHRYRADLDDKLYRAPKLFPSPAEKELKAIRDRMTEALETRGEEAAQKLGTEFQSKLRQLNGQYGVLSTIEKSTVDNEVREITNRRLSLTDNIWGAGALSLFSGHLATAPLALVGSLANKFLRKEGNVLLAHAGDKFGVLFSEQAMRHVAEKLDRIPEILTAMATRKHMHDKSDDEHNAMADFMGDFNTKKSAHEQFKALSSKINDIVSNDYALVNGSMKLSNAITDTGAPNVGSAYMTKQIDAIKYLHSVMPKPISPPRPFQKDDWKPSDQQLSTFAKQVKVAKDPFVIFQKLQDATLTKPEVDTMRALYPKLYGRLVSKVSEVASSGKVEIPYDGRLKLSLLVGQPLDASLQPQTVKALQALYGQPDQKKKGGGGGAGGGRHSSKAIGSLPSFATDAVLMSAGQKPR